MTILILYATTEGQTRKIARRAASHLTTAGHSVELVPAAEADEIDLARFKRALLMASIHAGQYQRALVDYVTSHRTELAALPTAFLSVSLSAAGTNPDDRNNMEKTLADMIRDTGWTPDATLHVAGAFRFGEYDFFKSWAMRWIATQRDPAIDTKGNTEYTDWQKVYDFVAQWAGAPAN